MKKAFLFLLMPLSLIAREKVQPYVPPKPLATPAATPSTAPTSPLFTGPLIAPIGQVIPYGDFEIESYVYATTETGTYNSKWHTVSAKNNFFSLNSQFLMYFGLTPWMDINISPQFYYNTASNQNTVVFGDLPVALDFQLLDASATPYFPGIKFTIRETFPTGPYQRLSPKRLLTDEGGLGTFATSFNLVLYKVYNLWKNHFLSMTYSALYTLNAPVEVEGLNSYGGGPGTNGKILPGDIFQAIASFEFSLSTHWALALDNVYQHTNSTEFLGTTIDPVGLPSSEQISFAPGIEYNLSSHFGIIAGCWFTAWGRNTTEFRSGVINFSYTY